MSNTAILETEEPVNKHFRPMADPVQRILVVEDDADIRRLNTELLVHYGYDVDAAEDGESAWAALATQDYDLMITDNNMPKVTGVQLLKKMQGASMVVPVIMATSVVPKWEFSQNPLIVPAALLQKPYTSAELLGVVNTVLRASANPDEPIALPAYTHSQPLPNPLPLE